MLSRSRHQGAECMNEVKFSCPSCGQNIRCEPGHSGENVPCPNCAKVIRVPLDPRLVPSEAPESDDPVFPPLESEKVSYTSEKSAVDEPERTLQPSVAKEESSQISPPTSALVSNEKSSTAAGSAHSLDLRGACPVCHAQLQISIQPAPGASVTPDPKPKSESHHQTFAERERQIEAAHQAIQASPSLTPQIKPRLDRILDGGATSS